MFRFSLFRGFQIPFAGPIPWFPSMRPIPLGGGRYSHLHKSRKSYKPKKRPRIEKMRPESEPIQSPPFNVDPRQKITSIDESALKGDRSLGRAYLIAASKALRDGKITIKQGSEVFVLAEMHRGALKTSGQEIDVRLKEL